MHGDTRAFPGGIKAWKRPVVRVKNFAVNVRGTFLCSKAVASRMVKNGWQGKIVNMSSQSAREGDKMQPAYNASKAAIMSYTQSLAKELAPYGINVNSVGPGIMDTQLTEMRFLGLYMEMQKLGKIPPGVTLEQFKILSAKESRIPLGRLGTADEVADLVAFLVSDRARYITGQLVNINGGQLMA